jgi:flagellin
MQIINTNIAALNSQRRLDESERELSTVYQRLSSGLRINSAKDDAAGLSVSVRFEAQVREANQGIKNTNDGISLIQTLDGGLDTISRDVQRIRDLAVQANNGTLADVDRIALQQEVDALVANIDQTAKNTTFNGINLLNDDTQLSDVAEENGPGVIDFTDNPDQLAVMQGLTEGWLESSEDLIRTFYGIEGDNQSLTITLADTVVEGSDGAGGTLAYVQVLVGASGPAQPGSVQMVIDMADFVPPNLPNGGTAPMYNDRVIAHEMVHAVMAVTTNYGDMNTWFKEGTAEFIHGADERISGDLAAAGSSTALVQQGFTGVGTPEAWGGSSAEYSSSTLAVRYLHDSIVEAGGNGIIDIFTELKSDPNTVTLDQAIGSVATNLGGLSAYVSGAGFTGGAITDEASLLAAYRASGADYLDQQINLTNDDTGSIQGSDVNPLNDEISAEDAVLDPLDYNSDPLQGWREVWPRGFEVQPSDVPEEPTSFEELAFDSVNIQFGSSQLDSVNLLLFGATSTALDMADVDVVADAESVITKADAALDRISLNRAFAGAGMNRLDAVASNLSIQKETFSASLSRIRDADFASESANLARLQVLTQSGISLLSQANARSQQVLQLLQ